MEQAIYNFNSHVKGDTFKAITFTVTVNDDPLDLTGASIRMQLRLSPLHPVAYELSTAGDQIEITDAVNGKFQIKKQIIDFPAAVYYYDIEITLADGDVKTYVAGKWQITQDVTH